MNRSDPFGKAFPEHSVGECSASGSPDPFAEEVRNARDATASRLLGVVHGVAIEGEETRDGEQES